MEVMGNAVSIATGHTSWTNEMVFRTVGSAGSTTNLQNLSYAWDKYGNMLQRKDNRQNLTEGGDTTCFGWRVPTIAFCSSSIPC